MITISYPALPLLGGLDLPQGICRMWVPLCIQTPASHKETFLFLWHCFFFMSQWSFFIFKGCRCIPSNNQLAIPFIWCTGDPLGTSVNTRDCLQRNCVFPVLPAGSHYLFFDLKKPLTPWKGNQTVLHHQDKMQTVPYAAKPAKHKFNPNFKLFLNT